MSKRMWGKQRAHKHDHAHSNYQFKRQTVCQPRLTIFGQKIKFTPGDLLLEEYLGLATSGSFDNSSPPREPLISLDYIQTRPTSPKSPHVKTRECSLPPPRSPWVVLDYKEPRSFSLRLGDYNSWPVQKTRFSSNHGHITSVNPLPKGVDSLNQLGQNRLVGQLEEARA